jgi:RND family efflux transporter MFP subunit
MKIRKKYILSAIVILIIIGGYYWYNKNQQGSVQTQYITQAVEKGTLAKTITASGNLVVDQQATVDPTISGTVAGLVVNVGDLVKKGQFLFNIVNNDLDANVADAQSTYLSKTNAVESAELSVKSAKADYDAAKKDDTRTKKQKDVLKKKIDIAENDLALAQKNLEAYKISYQNILNDASQRKVTSPIDGTVNEINIKNGDDLGKNSNSSSSVSPIIIGDLNTLKASVSVNEVDMPNVSIGQKVTLKVDALDSLEASGTVEKINKLGTETQGVVTYTVTIKLDSLDSRMLPKMSITASIISNSKEDVLAVPTSAITTEGNNHYVEVLNNGIPQKIKVQIGISNDTETEITSGLNAGDKVVTQKIESSSSSSSSSSSNQGGGFGGMMGGPPQ